MDDLSPAKQKLVSYLLKRDPNLSVKELSVLLNDLKRFVKVVQRIYTEPQGQIKFRETTKGGVKTKQRIIETDIEEVSKLANTKDEPITVETLRKITEIITGDKYKKHGE